MRLTHQTKDADRRHILRDLGDGLLLRRATPADTDALVAFHGDVHRDPGVEEPVEGVAALARDMLERDHPTMRAGDFTLVEDTRSGAIVSSLCLIPQTWSYGGIHFGVGRPELVGTHPDYRQRGLVRAQFEVVHARCARRGLKLQGITGIPWFYRQFGYEMGLTLGGRRTGPKSSAPALKDGEQEPYRVRPATEADLPFVAQLYEEGTKRLLVSCVRDLAVWRYELSGRSEKNEDRRELRVIEASDGEPVGFLVHAPKLWRQDLAISVYELESGTSWLDATPSVLRTMRATGEQYAARDGGRFETLAFSLGAEHPVYDLTRDRLPRVHEPYAWYVRVPDLPDFLRHVVPVLERRLAGSVLAGYTGVLKLSFYRDGLRLTLEGGRLAAVEAWQPTREDDGDAAFPDLTFLQLLFGYRTLEELDFAFADCRAGLDRTRALLNALFPRQPSNVWPLT
jgi:GNAT superfamily N-acetyltransferase